MADGDPSDADADPDEPRDSPPTDGEPAAEESQGSPTDVTDDPAGEGPTDEAAADDPADEAAAGSPPDDGADGDRTDDAPGVDDIDPHGVSPDIPVDEQTMSFPDDDPEGDETDDADSFLADEERETYMAADDGGDGPPDDVDPIEAASPGETPHAPTVPGRTRPGLFERDPRDVSAAVPADVPTDWGTPATPAGGGATDHGNAPGYEDIHEGAPDDEEMPLADHVEEMATRLFIVVGVAAVVAVFTLPTADELINFLWYSFHEGTLEQAREVCGTVDADAAAGTVAADVNCPYVYSPLALILARLKVATLVGFIVALPVFVYETYLFMRPGLYPRERRYYLAAVPTSLVLASVGVAVAYFAVLPAMFNYFIAYSDRAADLAFGLSHTFSIIILMLGFFALIFQIPLFVMLAIMMGVTTRRWLADRRLYFWGAFAAIAFVFSPDPTGMAPLMVAVTMILLFEGTLLLLKWTGTSSPVPTADELRARRPVVYAAFALVGYVLSPLPVPTGYYAQLPTAVTEGLASVGLGNATPMLVGGGIIALFELTAYWNKNYYGSVRAWRGLRRARLPVWGVAIVVGYLGSPDPTLFRIVNSFSVAPTLAAAVAAGLVLVFEGGLLVDRLRGDDGADEPDVPAPEYGGDYEPDPAEGEAGPGGRDPDGEDERRDGGEP
ncbi:twin-arginine translocase subunit TatC [Haloarcula litorea]|uniref:twin-arginine translocase subunit TatC n=1 Tax=Haloarcula litorea TaxID=3032579 RepID=UPI0023E8307C|nr:twin-arginine translocase subunit TatC [Halomicroarcula sp. GDY20]